MSGRAATLRRAPSSRRATSTGTTPSRLTSLRLAVIGWALLATCWALVSPLASVPDEPAHVIYAAAVVRGEVGPGLQPASYRVPAPVAGSGALPCTAFRPSVTAECTPALEPAGAPERDSVTPAVGYPPLYYALVGWPTLLPFGDLGWYAMRLTSVVLAAALLWVAASAWTREAPLVTAGLLLAATPMTGFMAGSVNPNGPEIVAGVAVVLAGTGLFDGWRREGRVARRAVVATLVPAGYLALARPSTYLPAAALLAVLALFGAAALRARPTITARLTAAGAAVIAVGLVAGRLVRATPVADGTAVPSAATGPPPSALAASLRQTFDLALTWARETVGIFGWRDHEVPLLLSATWLGLIAAAVAWALVLGTLWHRLALVALVLGGFLAGPFFTVLTVFGGGGGYQGRYAMALTAAVPVLAAAVLTACGASSPRVVRLLPGLLLALSVLALLGSALRYAVGLPLPSPRYWAGQVLWLPAAWPAVLLLLVAAVGVTAGMTRHMGAGTGGVSRRPGPDKSAHP